MHHMDSVLVNSHQAARAGTQAREYVGYVTAILTIITAIGPVFIPEPEWTPVRALVAEIFLVTLTLILLRRQFTRPAERFRTWLLSPLLKNIPKDRPDYRMEGARLVKGKGLAVALRPPSGGGKF